jgi:hypothetical protein
MAGGAVSPQSARMRIVANVTAGALARRIPIALARRMTAGAGESGVRAPQWKVGEIVIERRGIELYDIRLAPQVVRMTCAALGRSHGRRVPVQPLVVTDVRRDLLVAGEAEAGLPASIMNVMTQRTMLLEFLVRLRQLSWHEQRLRIDGLNATHVRRQSKKQKER